MVVCTSVHSCRDKQDVKNHTIIRAFGSTADEANFSEFFDVENIIKLDSKEGFLLGHTKFFVGKKYIVVKNGMKNQDLLFFDKESGLAVSKFNRFGKGPDEYFFIQSVNMLENDSIIEVGTSNKSQLIQFDRCGNVVSSKSIPLRYWNDAVYLNANTFCLFSSSGFGKNRMFQYAAYNFNTEELTFNLKIDESQHYISYSGLSNFTWSNDTLFLSGPIFNSIYSVSEEGLTERYFIDFGKDAIPSSFLSEKYRDVVEFHSKLRSTSYAYHHGSIHITNNHIIIESYKEQDKYLVIFCKKSGGSKIVKSLIADLPFSTRKEKFFPKIVHCSDEFIYISIEPEEIAKWFDVKLPEFGEFEPISSDLSNILSSISKSSVSDNPYLIKCKLNLF